MYVKHKFAKKADGFKQAKARFLKLFIMDPDAFGTQMEAIIAGKWSKHKEVSIKDHGKRFVWLLYCLEYLHRTGKHTLEKEERKKYYFKSFPPVWTEKFNISEIDFERTNKMAIDTYMTMMKKEADKASKKKEQEKNKNKNKNNNDQNQKGGKNKRKRNQDKKNFEGKCRKHPNGKHT